VDERCGVDRVPGPFAAQLPPGQHPQFLIHTRHQRIDHIAVSAAEIGQQLGDFLVMTHSFTPYKLDNFLSEITHCRAKMEIFL
jgi:hypothetical protein